jgi:small subunit ribosomal protein S9
MAGQYYEGIGRRKSSTARVRISDGSGEFVVNEKSLDEYFPRIGDAGTILGALDVSALVKGGGVTGQTDAVKLGLARALLKMDPELRTTLRRGGYLTRNPREKERKKPGLKRARKAPTYTKR